MTLRTRLLYLNEFSLKIIVFFNVAHTVIIKYLIYFTNLMAINLSLNHKIQGHMLRYSLTISKSKNSIYRQINELQANSDGLLAKYQWNLLFQPIINLYTDMALIITCEI